MSNQLSTTLAQNLPADSTLMRAEMETISAIAAARPRSWEQVLERIREQLRAYPQFAEAALYERPVGRDASGAIQYASGLSIRAAEAIAEAYGYCGVYTHVEPIDNSHVRITARFVDYQQCRVWHDTAIVSRQYRASDGTMRSYSEDRWHGVVIRAAMSRLVREVILRSIPPGLRAAIEAAARANQAKLEPAVVTRILEQFAKLGVLQPVLENALGLPAARWGQQERVRLLGWWNALRDGEVSAADLFGEQRILTAAELADRPAGEQR